MKTDRKEKYSNFQLDRYVLIERENIKQKKNKQNKINLNDIIYSFMTQIDDIITINTCFFALYYGCLMNICPIYLMTFLLASIIDLLLYQKTMLKEFPRNSLIHCKKTYIHNRNIVFHNSYF